MIHHVFLKSFFPFLVFVLYLMKPGARVFKWIRAGLYLGFPAILILYAWRDPREIIINTWSKWTSPIIYLVYILVLDKFYRIRTSDPGYSLMMSVHSALMAGYIYEIPRYLDLNVHLIRFNQASIYWLDPGVVACIQVPILLFIRGWKPKRIHVLTGGFYLAYLIGYRVPILGIMGLRLPSLILCYSLALGLTDKDRSRLTFFTSLNENNLGPHVG